MSEQKTKLLLELQRLRDVVPDEAPGRDEILTAVDQLMLQLHEESLTPELESSVADFIAAASNTLQPAEYDLMLLMRYVLMLDLGLGCLEGWLRVNSKWQGARLQPLASFARQQVIDFGLKALGR